MQGKRVERRFGWDCHGLPVEMEMEKTLELDTSKALEAYGIDKFNESCRAIVLRYAEQWRETITRIGRWVDFDNGYKTMNPSFMESVWWVFGQLWRKGLIYEGHRVMPYSWRSATALSNFEANLNYKDVQDPSITISVALTDEQDAYLLIWTTTPWTLPSNLAVCAGTDLDYVAVRDIQSNKLYYLAEARKTIYFDDEKRYVVEKSLRAMDLKGRVYRPMFPYFATLVEQGGFKVVVDDYVTTESGTGLVHIAPAYGEDDYRIGRQWQLPFVDPVDNDGNFTDAVSDFAGQNIKQSDKAIVRALKNNGSLFRHETLQHSYPFCWRTDTPLMYKAIRSWFVKVEDFKDRLVANNAQVHWVPGWVGEGRFGNWLRDARDWNISRNRYWGSCIPIWRCDNNACGHAECVDSREQLQHFSGIWLEDLHKHFVDKVTWQCAECQSGTMTRIPEVFDCWFESGSMPYAQQHYPFENKAFFEANFPADFIAEGVDQTRGWFYTLLVLSTALFDKPAFQNVIVNGLIMAADGKKMSKREKNYTPPEILIHEFGSDAVRFYMLGSPAVEGQNLRFVDDDVKETTRTLLIPIWNAYRFFTEYANADRYYTQGLKQAPEHALDRFILSDLNICLRNVTRSMNSYDLTGATRVLVEFIDSLNNWYIRRSRRRFWKSENDADKLQAFDTLYEVLCRFSLMLAPFLPFLTEHIFRNLTGKESVHLQAWPKVQQERIDQNLSADIHAVRCAVALAHQIRSRQKIKTRQPLALAKIAGLSTTQIEQYKDVILDEINVKAIEHFADVGAVAKRIVRPNGRMLGPRLRGAVQQVIKKAKAGDFTELGDGTVQVDGHILQAGEFEFGFDVAEGFECESRGEIVVLLDTQISEQLRREGYARDVTRALQDMRKEADYHVSDRVAVAISGADQLMLAVEEHRQYLCNEVLIVAFNAEGQGRWDIEKEVIIDGQALQLRMCKAGKAS